MINKSLEFRTYELKNHNPFEHLPEGKYIAAEADHDGLYTLHLRFDNGLGISSTGKLTLYQVVVHAIKYAEELGYTDRAIWFDLPDHVLEQPDVLNQTLKRRLKKKGMYWKNGRNRK